MKADNQTNLITKKVVDFENSYQMAPEDKQRLWDEITTKQSERKLWVPVLFYGVAAVVIFMIILRFWPQPTLNEMGPGEGMFATKIEESISKSNELNVVESSKAETKIIAEEEHIEPSKKLPSRQANLGRIASIFPESISHDWDVVDIAKRIQDYTVAFITANEDYDLIVYDFKEHPKQSGKDNKRAGIKLKLNFFKSDNRITKDSFGKAEGLTLASSNRNE